MHTDLEAWLKPRLERAPESLRARISDALSSDQAPVAASQSKGRAAEMSASMLPKRLRTLGESLLEEAKLGKPTHDTAVTLLAADALITYSCEAEAALQESWGDRLGEAS